MKIFYSIFLCILFLGLKSIVAFSEINRLELYENDSCRLNTSTNGTCKKFDDCPPVKDAVRQDRNYDDRVVCGYDGFTEIVCCPNPRIDLAEQACSSYTKRRQTRIMRYLDAITRGIAAVEGEFPYMAALGYHKPGADGETTTEYDCGGTLISLQFVLTAAHCVSNYDERVPYQVRLGSTSLRSQSENVQEIRIKNQIVHPEYRRSRGLYDIALLELEDPIEWSRHVQPICLQTTALQSLEPAWNEAFVVAGFGAAEMNGPMVKKLLKTPSLSLLSSKVCEPYYSGMSLFPDGLSDHTYCARDPNATRQSDSCQGDSGGPLVKTSHGEDRLIGITSFGKFCGSSTPSGYISVFSFLRWIEEHVF